MFCYCVNFLIHDKVITVFLLYMDSSILKNTMIIKWKYVQNGELLTNFKKNSKLLDTFVLARMNITRYIKFNNTIFQIATKLTWST